MQSVGYHSLGTNVPNAAGCEVAFAHALLAHQFGAPRIAFIPTAVGGTSLAEFWQPGRTYYSNMLHAVHHAMKSGQHHFRGAPLRLRGMIWVQGEQDGMIQFAKDHQR